MFVTDTWSKHVQTAPVLETKCSGRIHLLYVLIGLCYIHFVQTCLFITESSLRLVVVNMSSGLKNIGWYFKGSFKKK